MPKQDVPETPRRREPLTTETKHGYYSYNDVRGDAAKALSVAMGIDEKSGIKHTGHLAELRESPSHTRISAHATTYAREVLVYSDQSVIMIDLDRVKEEAVQTVYSPNGDIEVLKTGWSYEANGHHGPYERVSLSSGHETECKAEWEKYETLIQQALEKLRHRALLPQGHNHFSNSIHSHTIRVRRRAELHASFLYLVFHRPLRTLLKNSTSITLNSRKDGLSGFWYSPPSALVFQPLS